MCFGDWKDVENIEENKKERVFVLFICILCRVGKICLMLRELMNIFLERFVNFERLICYKCDLWFLDL